MKSYSKLIELLEDCLLKNIPFVCYRKENEENIYTIIQKTGAVQMVKSIKDVIDLSGFVYAPFHERTLFPVIFFEPEISFVNNEIPGNLLEEIKNGPLMYPLISFENIYPSDKPTYLRQARTFIQSFNDDLKKTVLSRQIIENKKEFKPIITFINLCNTYPEAFCHIINIPGAGTWMGASPEILFRTHNEKALCHALAGTRMFNNSDTKWGNKEMEEQHLVTEHIRNIFSDFGINDYIEKGPETIVAGAIEHLSTTFEFDYDIIKENLVEFLQALHPTPAVCGFPTEQALNLIFDTEMHNREYYSGFFGLLNLNKENHLMVNLRCMKVSDKIQILFVGGGLTKQSDPEKEWQETKLKADTLIRFVIPD